MILYFKTKKKSIMLLRKLKHFYEGLNSFVKNNQNYKGYFG